MKGVPGHDLLEKKEIYSKKYILNAQEKTYQNDPTWS